MSNVATLRRAAAAKDKAALKWTEADARLCEAVIEANEAGMPMAQIAREIGVTREYAYQLRNRKTGALVNHSRR